jgi:L-2-hydroxycarboxylate dehydrogenase (NAD+)
MPVVTAGQASARIEAALARLGVAADEARVQATALVEADLRGHASHGLRRLPTLAARILNGVTVPGAVTRLDWLTESVLRADGQGGLGPVVARRAAAALTERVPRTGVAVAAIARASHLGILAPYVEELSGRGLTTLMTTTSEALVHASHGNRAIVGTNPLAIGIPAPGAPVVLDMATGLVSMGKIIDYAARGEPLPAGWAVDAAGQPTTDAAAAARGGAIAPFGGGKGYGLALALELLVAVLTSTALGTGVRGTLDTDQPATKGDLIIVFDTGLFTDVAAAARRVAAYLDEVRATAVPGEQVFIPGDRARAARAARLADGIAIPDELWATVTDLAGDAAS